MIRAQVIGIVLDDLVVDESADQHNRKPYFTRTVAFNHRKRAQDGSWFTDWSVIFDAPFWWSYDNNGQRYLKAEAKTALAARKEGLAYIDGEFAIDAYWSQKANSARAKCVFKRINEFQLIQRPESNAQSNGAPANYGSPPQSASAHHAPPPTAEEMANAKDLPW